MIAGDNVQYNTIHNQPSLQTLEKHLLFPSFGIGQGFKDALYQVPHVI
jgi:hypothetical protein